MKWIEALYRRVSSEGLVAVKALRRARVAVRLAARFGHVGIHRRRAAREDADAFLLQAACNI